MPYNADTVQRQTEPAVNTYVQRHCTVPRVSTCTAAGQLLRIRQHPNVTRIQQLHRPENTALKRVKHMQDDPGTTHK